jgi:hypothetical protein
VTLVRFEGNAKVTKLPEPVLERRAHNGIRGVDHLSTVPSVAPKPAAYFSATDTIPTVVRCEGIVSAGQ